MAKKTPQERLDQQNAEREKRIAAGAQVKSIEETWAEHLLTEHGISAYSQTASRFHERYYRACPFYPPPPQA